MTYYTYKSRTLHHRRINRRYRQLVLVLCAIITLLTVLLITSQSNVARANEIVVETYHSHQVRTGECLWDLAEEYKLEDMSTEEYIDEIKQINHLKNSQLISGEYVIIPIYTYDPSL